MDAQPYPNMGEKPTLMWETTKESCSPGALCITCCLNCRKLGSPLSSLRWDAGLLPQQRFTASLTPERDPREAEFRFPRQVKFVYLLGLRCPDSLLEGVFLFRSNLHTRRQKLGPRGMVLTCFGFPGSGISFLCNDQN